MARPLAGHPPRHSPRDAEPTRCDQEGLIELGSGAAEPAPRDLAVVGAFGWDSQTRSTKDRFAHGFPYGFSGATMSVSLSSHAAMRPTATSEDSPVETSTT